MTSILRTSLAVLALVFAGVATAQASEEARFLELINAYRAEHGLGSLTITPLLTKSSVWMSRDMADNNYMSHTDSQGRDPFERMDDLGYDFNTYKGENLAAGQVTAEEAFEGWRTSPGHNANMLKPEFKAIGIARVYKAGTTYGYYWTTNFGGYVDGHGEPPPSSGGEAGPSGHHSAPGDSPVAQAREWVRQNDPMASTAIFFGTAMLVDKMMPLGRALPIRAMRWGLPAVAASLLVDYLHGATPRDMAINAAAWGTTGIAVGAFADLAVVPLLMRFGAPGFALSLAYTATWLIGTYFLGQKMEDWFHQLFDKKGGGEKASGGAGEAADSPGMKSKVDAIESGSR